MSVDEKPRRDAWALDAVIFRQFPLAHLLNDWICPCFAKAMQGTALPQRLTLCICQYDCIHTAFRHPHFQVVPVRAIHGQRSAMWR